MNFSFQREVMRNHENRQETAYRVRRPALRVSMLDCYLQGDRRTCIDTLSMKYGVSPQVVRKYKRQLEASIKKFGGGVSF